MSFFLPREGHMALNIKSVTAERKVRLLARATGETISEAVERAAEERLARLRSERGVEAKMRRVKALLDSFGPVPPGPDQRSIDDWMYDEHGLPH